MDISRVKVITITLTQSCNLSCVYCYEQYKSQKTIDLETAKCIIDEELKDHSAFDSIEIDFFGGEPFLAFETLKDLTDYINQKYRHLPITLFTTTNGTLVHGEIQEWLRNYRDLLVCCLSLDGTSTMHNINRSGSYDDIDLAFFQELYPHQDVKMTISKETLPYLAEGVIDMHQKGFLVSCNLAYGFDWSDSGSAKILERELYKLIEFYLLNPEMEPCSMLEMGISGAGTKEIKATRYCGAGLSMRAYDVDGIAYPCQFFMPLSVGNEKAANAKTIVFPNDVIDENHLDEMCGKCVIRSICPTCFGSNYAATGNIYSRDENMCLLTKITMKARSYFRAKQWELGQLHLSPDEEQMLLRAIVRIQEELEI